MQARQLSVVNFQLFFAADATLPALRSLQILSLQYGRLHKLRQGPFLFFFLPVVAPRM